MKLTFCLSVRAAVIKQNLFPQYHADKLSTLLLKMHNDRHFPCRLHWSSRVEYGPSSPSYRQATPIHMMGSRRRSSAEPQGETPPSFGRQLNTEVEVGSSIQAEHSSTPPPLELQRYCSSPVKMSVAHYEAKFHPNAFRSNSIREEIQGEVQTPPASLVTNESGAVLASSSVASSQSPHLDGSAEPRSADLSAHNLDSSSDQGNPRRGSEPGKKPKKATGKRFNSVSVSRIRPSFLSKSTTVNRAQTPPQVISPTRPGDQSPIANELRSAIAAVRQKDDEGGIQKSRKELSKSLECLTADSPAQRPARSITPPPGCSPLWFKPRPRPRANTCSTAHPPIPHSVERTNKSEAGPGTNTKENSHNATVDTLAPSDRLEMAPVGCFMPRAAPRSHKKKKGQEAKEQSQNEPDIAKTTPTNSPAQDPVVPAEDQPYEEVSHFCFGKKAECL